jgi:hypothetical protein
MMEVLREFPDIIGVDFTYLEDTMEPLAMTYLWEDDQ